jgi:hypothetical protein
MASIQDILSGLPNFFGSTPEAYRGLLTSEQSTGLEKRANLAGLLGFAGALAQGMSPQGYRRSALQNILSAAGAGFGGAAQTYDAGLNQLANVQKLQQSQAQITAINNLLQRPEIANDPMMVAYIRANPGEAIKYFAEMAPLQKAISGGTPVTPATPSLITPSPAVISPTSAAVTTETTSAEVLPGVTVQGQRSPTLDFENQKTELMTRINQLRGVNQRISGLPTKQATDIRAANNAEITNLQNQIKTIDDQIGKISVAEYDFDAVKNLVPEQFKGSVDSLRKAAETGTLTMDKLIQRLQDIEKGAIEFVTKKTDYTNQDRRVFGGMFQNPDGTPRAIETASPVELMQLENKLYEMRIQERKAGATNINMPTESERTAGFLTNRVVNSLNQLQTVVGAKPTAASPNFGAEAVRFLTGSEYLKNLANPEARQQVEAAQLEILDAALTLGTGAAYTREQLENYRRSYFPQLGDKQGTVSDKQQRLKSLIDSAMIKSGRAAPNMPSGVAPAFDLNAIQQELDRRKGK